MYSRCNYLNCQQSFIFDITRTFVIRYHSFFIQIIYAKETASIYQTDILSHPQPFDSLPDIEKKREAKENEAMSVQIQTYFACMYDKIFCLMEKGGKGMSSKINSMLNVFRLLKLGYWQYILNLKFYIDPKNYNHNIRN